MAFAWRTADSRRFGLFQAQNSDWSEPWPPRVPQPEVKSLRAYFRVRCGKVRIFSGCKSRPATQSLQPVAIGAAVEVTKPPKPPMQRVALATPRAGRP